MRAPSHRGFSLIEILVAVTVLSLLTILVAQIIESASRVTRASNRLVNATGQAHIAFDRLRHDLDAAVLRTDTEFSTASPHTLLFVAGITSPGSTRSPALPTNRNRGLSLVSYLLAPHPDNGDKSALLRAAKAVAWDEATPFMGLAATGLPVRLADISGDLLPTPAPDVENDYDVLAPGVIRMVVGYQVYPDLQAATLMNNTASTGNGALVYSPPRRTNNPTGMQDFIDMRRVSALVVGIVAVDGSLLQNPAVTDAALAALAADFPDPVSGQTPCAAWGPKAVNAGSMSATAPLFLRQSVRIFERAYPIRPYQP